MPDDFWLICCTQYHKSYEIITVHNILCALTHHVFFLQRAMQYYSWVARCVRVFSDQLNTHRNVAFQCSLMMSKSRDLTTHFHTPERQIFSSFKNGNKFINGLVFKLLYGIWSADLNHSVCTCASCFKSLFIVFISLRDPALLNLSRTSVWIHKLQEYKIISVSI